MEGILLVKEVSEILKLSEEYIRRMLREKRLKGYFEGRRGGYRILSSSVKEYVENRMKDL